MPTLIDVCAYEPAREQIRAPDGYELIAITFLSADEAAERRVSGRPIPECTPGFQIIFQRSPR